MSSKSLAEQLFLRDKHAASYSVYDLTKAKFGVEKIQTISNPTVYLSERPTALGEGVTDIVTTESPANSGTDVSASSVVKEGETGTETTAKTTESTTRLSAWFETSVSTSGDSSAIISSTTSGTTEGTSNTIGSVVTKTSTTTKRNSSLNS
jgi:hypothetical protein